MTPHELAEKCYEIAFNEDGDKHKDAIPSLESILTEALGEADKNQSVVMLMNRNAELEQELKDVYEECAKIAEGYSIWSDTGSKIAQTIRLRAGELK